MIYGWSPGIGDPSLLGWFTVFGYFLAAILCVQASRTDFGAGRFWGVLAVALILLGLNKQLDIQSLLTAVGREIANSEGWYDQRRALQKYFVIAVGSLAITGSIAAVFILRNRSRHIRAASAGFVLLSAFICIRAASFHHIDRILNAGILGARFNWIIELGGIFLVAINAFGATSAAAVKSKAGCVAK